MYIGEYEGVSGLGRGGRRRGIRRIGRAVRRAALPIAAIATGAAVPAAVPAIVQAAQARAARRVAQRTPDPLPAAPASSVEETTQTQTPPVRLTTTPVQHAAFTRGESLVESTPSVREVPRALPALFNVADTRFPVIEPAASTASPPHGNQWLIPALILGGVVLFVAFSR